jgi:hypothetical protein
MDGGVSVVTAPTWRPVTRRGLLRCGGIAAAALTLGEGVRVVERAVTTVVQPGLRRSDYQPYIGRRFRISAPGAAALSIPLVAVRDVGSPRSLAGSENAFILVFHAPAGSPRLEQAVMSIRHPRGWTRRLLMSPSSPDRNGLDYAAVINRVLAK